VEGVGRAARKKMDGMPCRVQENRTNKYPTFFFFLAAGPTHVGPMHNYPFSDFFFLARFIYIEREGKEKKKKIKLVWRRRV
jgi:hypothetical protein